MIICLYHAIKKGENRSEDPFSPFSVIGFIAGTTFYFNFPYFPNQKQIIPTNTRSIKSNTLTVNTYSIFLSSLISKPQAKFFIAPFRHILHDLKKISSSDHRIYIDPPVLFIVWDAMQI